MVGINELMGTDASEQSLGSGRPEWFISFLCLNMYQVPTDCVISTRVFLLEVLGWDVTDEVERRSLPSQKG